MAALLLYWLKANVVLALFAVAYYGLLRQLTFFRLNRAYLLFALAFAAAYPWLPGPALLPAAVAALPLVAAGPVGPGPGGGAGATLPPDYARYLLLGAGAVYLVGVAALLLRLLGQLLSLARLRRQTRPAVVLGQAVRLVPGAGSPFSFGGTIYLTANALADSTNLPAALRHEQAHVRQHHTLDVLLWQLAAALAWANPAAWLLRRAALDNLEYLADAAALHDGSLSCRAYQYLLLHQQTGFVPTPALAFHIELLTLKNRIAMLNQPHSAPRQLGRYLLAAPLVVALALAYAGARAQPAARPTGAKSQALAGLAANGQHPAYLIDGQPSTPAAAGTLNPALIASMSVTRNRATVQEFAHDPAATSVIFITTKANANSAAVLALADKANLAEAFDYKPAPVSTLVPRALAYITGHYPAARLSGEVTGVRRKSSGEVRYQVQLVEGRRPFAVYFSPQGDFLGEQR